MLLNRVLGQLRWRKIAPNPNPNPIPNPNPTPNQGQFSSGAIVQTPLNKSRASY